LLIGGDHVDWIVSEHRETLPAHALEAMGLELEHPRFSTVVMGWNTYAAGLEQGVRDPYPHLEQIVFSRTRDPNDVPESIRLVGSDPTAEVRQLKRQSGQDIWLCGGGRLAATLSDEIDRMVLKTNPVILGGGRPVLDGAYCPRQFELLETKSFSSGVIVTEYRRI